MTVLELRKEMGLSQEAFAILVGLKAKSHVSAVEQQGATCSVKVALEIERLSEGRISAGSLNADVALVRNNDQQDAA